MPKQNQINLTKSKKQKLSTYGLTSKQIKAIQKKIDKERYQNTIVLSSGSSSSSHSSCDSPIYSPTIDYDSSASYSSLSTLVASPNTPPYASSTTPYYTNSSPLYSSPTPRRRSHSPPPTPRRIQIDSPIYSPIPKNFPLKIITRNNLQIPWFTQNSRYLNNKCIVIK